jgi:hypothetical protein
MRSTPGGGFVKNRWGIPHHVIAPLTLVVGLLMLTFGLHQTYDTYQFTKTATAFTGEVLSIEVKVKTSRKNGDAHSTIAYRPLTRFKDSTGVIQVKKTRVASSDYLYNNGELVDILYDPKWADHVRIDTFLAIWGFGIGLFISGLLFCTFGGIATRKAWAKRSGSSHGSRTNAEPKDEGSDAHQDKGDFTGRSPTVRRD